jgi:hypothetical protein
MLRNRAPIPREFIAVERNIFIPRDIHNNVLISDDASSFIKYTHESEIAPEDNIPPRK